MNTSELFALSPSERLQLVQDLWDSLLQTPEAVPVYQWHQDELDSREQEYLKNPNAGSPWSEVKARILARAKNA
jgi:putative addiction module component (TIGR02574 family)